MKQLSVKLKITGWLTILTAAISLLLLVFMFSISNRVVTQTAMSQLSQTVRRNLELTDMEGGKLQLGEGFTFYSGGVSTLLYSRSKALLAGQVPVAFTMDVPFENGVTRTVASESEQYLVLDLWLPLDWENGLWVRGLMEAPEQQQSTRNVIWMAVVALPIFILLAGLGSYLITRGAFRPLDSITATAAAINEAKDLSGRIALPAGRDEFSQLAATFDSMFQRLEQSFEAEKQFTADASHELRTPLSVIKGACDYAQKYNETPQEWQETMAMIQRQTGAMSRLIAQLLSITRLDQGTELLHPQLLDLGELARSVCQEQGCRPPRLELNLAAGVQVWADPGLLARLIQNLLENGLKYGKADGHVWVSVLETKTECLLEVGDDGMGIGPEHQEKIWQRFYQADPSRGEECGAGLGLAIVGQIARAHGGHMTLESTPGQGSRFTLHLPKTS